MFHHLQYAFGIPWNVFFSHSFSVWIQWLSSLLSPPYDNGKIVGPQLNLIFLSKLSDGG